MTASALSVTSHVGRDLLQSAGLFKHEHAVVWEYASNGLQYVDPGTNPVVRVAIDPAQRSITVSDNGRGMSFADLGGYFTMHGENIDRVRGRPGRGMFGTGKSAAFGIANTLRVTTIREGRRSRVELRRATVESADAKTQVPISVLEQDAVTSDANGTVVEILDVNLKRIDVASIIREIERHMAHWPNGTVFVGHHQCQYIEPATSQIQRFSTKGTLLEASLPDVELVIKVAKAPLSAEQQGIAVTASGVLHELTLAGCERRSFANYILGQIDVPALATDTSPISPFDMSRGMRLNPQNGLVQSIHAFVGMHVEIVCHELERQDRERRRGEDVKRLQKEADAIADILNKDFQDWRSRIRQVLAQTPGSTDTKPAIVDGAGEEVGGEGDVPASEVADLGGAASQRSGNGGPGPADRGPSFEKNEEGAARLAEKAIDRQRRSRGGGFNVDFRDMGKEESRAKYESAQRTILINLEHPQIKAALGLGGIEDPAFRRLAYEVAFSEYAIALAVELSGAGYFIDPSEPIFEIRDTMNRLATTAAVLYK